MTRAFLRTESLYLRGLVEADAAGSYVDWLNDQQTCAGNSHAVFPYGSEAALAYIRAAQSRRDALILAIVTTEGGKHIGNIALQNIDPIHHSAELAIMIGERDYWGRGYGLAAARLICRHGFDALNLRRIHCGTYASNTGMMKLALALGMHREGVRREAAYKAGRYLDVIEFGMLAGEMQGVPPPAGTAGQ